MTIEPTENLTSYLAYLNQNDKAISALINGELNPSVDDHIADGLLAQQAFTRAQIRSTENAICRKQKNASNKKIRVNRDRIIAAVGEHGLRNWEMRFTQILTQDKPYTGDITFVVNDFDYMRLTTELNAVNLEYIAEPNTELATV